MWLTVIGFEFRKHFPCSQKLSDCFSSRSTVIFFLFLSIILKVIFFIFFFFFFLPVTHCTWSISSTFGNSVPFFIYKFKIHGYSQDLLLKIQVCMSYSLWSLHVNVAEAPQTQQANVNFSSSTQHPSFRLYYFPSMPSTSLNDSVPPQCWILFLLHLSYLVIPETF